ncbi:MAG: TetR/AcrR family transcriptional regulator [Paracoccus sp. (in: a-proteobacteria)]|uniref:TetR/AcrR family transcriptional regulator n=1 Tax=Paracoccus sp. TaxID=267 RepID=UPI0026DF6A96|nr:TetR/AcrR family transcriptional regulator [Paracoccus sp. (in: a-proteobacteria)]MDO5611703.1 TetR/AcrR family transcriptional regulator [Paracoccus sp. (in: a-proteobacteria)]
MTQETPTADSPRDRLLTAAAALFYNDGINATGTDAIIRRADVARQSLYNNFGSKAGLVAAYLTARHDEWLALHAARAAVAQTPADRVLAVFDAYQDHAEDAYERGFRGCGLLNAAAELPADDPGRDAVRAHKEQVEGFLRDALAELTADPEPVARHLAFLLEGAITRAGLERRSDCVAQARAMAAKILAAL